ncbi:Rossmann-fold NAD(P)-binding domain-containing protein [Streptomyces sp. NPDC001714]|uniref:hypothetical protein n=1 Tax=Streptomyces sp. NPDC001714 TaxID=3364603 RepID=UPI0036A8F2F4
MIRGLSTGTPRPPLSCSPSRRPAAGRPTLITVNVLNPGQITSTRLGRRIGDISNSPASCKATSTDVSWKNIEQGAATSVLLAASPLVGA